MVGIRPVCFRMSMGIALLMRTPTPTACQMNVASWAIHGGGKGPSAGIFFDGPVIKSV